MSNKASDPIRVVTYARVSTTEQASEGTSMEFQDSRMTSYYQSQSWTLINSYTDPGYSGQDGHRPGHIKEHI